MRSPLVTIVSAAQVANGWDMGPPARRALAVMEPQSRHALRIIDDLFDACAGGQLPLRREAVDLADLVALATETVGHLLATRQHRLTVSLPPGRVSLEGDLPRLTQVLTNLLSNAAKFTEPGGHIRLCTGSRTAGSSCGSGTTAEGSSRTCYRACSTRFTKYRGRDGRRPRGLGLGLTLVKSLVELHGGSVAAFSDGRGTGSEFVVRLPAGRRHAMSPTPSWPGS